MSSSKNIDLEKDFAAGFYQSLWTGDTVSHVGIFDTAFRTVTPLTFSLVHLSHPSTPSLCRGGGGMGSGPQTDKHLPQSLFTGQFF